MMMMITRHYLLNSFKTACLKLRKPGEIWHKVSADATKTLACCFVRLGIDYSSSLLAGCAKHLLMKLQTPQNNAAGEGSWSSKLDHVFPLLGALHWLLVHQRIKYNLPLVYSLPLSLSLSLSLTRILTILPTVHVPFWRLNALENSCVTNPFCQNNPDAHALLLSKLWI